MRIASFKEPPPQQPTPDHFERDQSAWRQASRVFHVPDRHQHSSSHFFPVGGGTAWHR